MKPKIVLYGAGSNGLVVAEIVRVQDAYTLAGFLDDGHEERGETAFGGAPLLGGREQLSGLIANGVRHMIVSIGDCEARLKLAELALEMEFSLAIATHPSAVVASGVVIGAGSVVKANAVIEPGAVIGDNVIVGAQAYIGHECIIEDGAHISAGAKIGGKSQVGRASWVGIGATVKNDVRVGERVQIGAGAVVLEDVADGVVAFGVPARPLWTKDLWRDQ